MNTVSLLFAIIAAVCALSAGSADAWWYNEHNRVVFKGLPTAEYQWTAGDTVAVQFRFRRWRRSSKSFGLRLDNKLMRKVNLKNAEISEDVNEDGFYTAVFKLPSNLGTSESYVLELETNGLFGTGLFDNTLAISQEFPVASKRDKERHLREIAERNAAKYEEAAAELAKTKEEAMEGNAVEGNAAPTVVPVVVKPVAVKPVVAVAPPTVAPATPVAGESASAPAKFFDLW